MSLPSCPEWDARRYELVLHLLRQDTAVGGNFGAFTTSRTANAARALGCSYVLIGHCEERKDKAGILAAGGGDPSAVNKILNQEIREAVRAGLKVLYCIGETSEEQPRWQEVLRTQLEEGLKDVDKGCVTIAYEPYGPSGREKPRRIRSISRKSAHL